MDINKASAEELEQAFEVDGTRAHYLVDRRNKIGGFKSWDDVKQVPGFEDKMVENLQAAGLTLGSERESHGEHGYDGRSGGEREHGRRGMNVNTASAEELQNVFQIDGERSRYLVEARKRLGGFHSWDEIKREVPSFEDGMIENMKEAGARLG